MSQDTTDLDYQKLYNNITKVFTKQTQSLANLKYFMDLICNYAKLQVTFTTQVKKMKQMTATKPTADSDAPVEALQQTLQKAFYNQNQSSIKFFQYVKLTAVKVVQQQKKVQKMIKTYTSKYNKMLAIRKKLQGAEILTKTQYQKTKLPDQQTVTKAQQSLQKADQAQQVLTKKAQEQENAIDMLIHDYLNIIQNLDNERMDIIFKCANEIAVHFQSSAADMSQSPQFLQTFISSNDPLTMLKNFYVQNMAKITNLNQTAYKNQMQTLLTLASMNIPITPMNVQQMCQNPGQQLVANQQQQNFQQQNMVPAAQLDQSINSKQNQQFNNYVNQNASQQPLSTSSTVINNTINQQPANMSVMSQQAIASNNLNQISTLSSHNVDQQVIAPQNQNNIQSVTNQQIPTVYSQDQQQITQADEQPIQLVPAQANGDEQNDQYNSIPQHLIPDNQAADNNNWQQPITVDVNQQYQQMEYQ